MKNIFQNPVMDCGLSWARFVEFEQTKINIRGKSGLWKRISKQAINLLFELQTKRNCSFRCFFSSSKSNHKLHSLQWHLHNWAFAGWEKLMHQMVLSCSTFANQMTRNLLSATFKFLCLFLVKMGQVRCLKGKTSPLYLPNLHYSTVIHVHRENLTQSL